MPEMRSISNRKMFLILGYKCLNPFSLGTFRQRRYVPTYDRIHGLVERDKTSLRVVQSLIRLSIEQKEIEFRRASKRYLW